MRINQVLGRKRRRCRNRKGGRDSGPLLTRFDVLSTTRFDALSTPAAAAAAARAPLARLVDVQVAAAEVLVVQAFDRGAGRVGVHLDETETSRTTGVAVGDEGHVMNGSERLESRTYVLGGRIERKVTDIKSFVSHGITPFFHALLCCDSASERSAAIAIVTFW